MPMLHVHAVSPCCISLLHGNAAYPCFMSISTCCMFKRLNMLCVHAARPSPWTCCMNMNMNIEMSVKLSLKMMMMWKEAQQLVRQHWFIDSYISAYIQTLYMYTRLVWSSTRGVGRCPQ
jgi:hypothetical protein